MSARGEGWGNRLSREEVGGENCVIFVRREGGQSRCKTGGLGLKKKTEMTIPSLDHLVS